MTYPARILHTSIDRPVAEVYAFAADPNNLSKWAAGLSNTPLRREDDVWLADSPMGRVQITFAAKNEFGVIDHEVLLPNGPRVMNPLRVQANGDGTEVIFTLYRLPPVSDEAFEEDADKVRADLAKLKSILES